MPPKKSCAGKDGVSSHTSHTGQTIPSDSDHGNSKVTPYRYTPVGKDDREEKQKA